MGLNLVIADDHPVALHGLRSWLERLPRERFRVAATATDGTGVLACLRGRDCDLLLMDWYMPDPGGLEGHLLLRQVAQRFPRLAVVVMTASLQPTVLGAALAAGAKGLFDKRSTLADLVRILREAARGGLGVSPGFEALLDRRYLSRHHWGGAKSHHLTAREREVLSLSDAGYNGRTIAARLSRSEKTISRQRRAALDKLGLNPDAEPPYLYPFSQA